MTVSNSFPLIGPLCFYSKAVNFCTGAATHSILALTFEAAIRMSLLSNTSLLFRGHIRCLFPHTARITNSDRHTKISSLLLYHWNRPFESEFVLKTVCTLDSVQQWHCLVFQTNGNKAESFFMCKAVHPKGKTSISMKNSQVTTKKLRFVEAHGFDCMFEPAYCHVSFLKSLNLIVFYSDVFLIHLYCLLSTIQFVLSVLAYNSVKTEIYWATEHNYPSVSRINCNLEVLLFLHPTHFAKILHYR